MIKLTHEGGGLIIPRALINNPYWVFLKPFQRLALIDILRHAVTEEAQYFRESDWRIIKPGQVLVNTEKDFEGMTGRQARAFLEKLKKDRIIDYETWKGGEGGGGTVVTVLNWPLYSDHALYECESERQ